MRSSLAAKLTSVPALRDPFNIVPIAALLVLVVPALMFGPWLPFVDLISFVGMDTYPPQLSYGPLHFYTFQFTYEGHYVLSRLMSDLHISAGGQVVAFYLGQVMASFIVVWRSLERVVALPAVRATAIALGTLAFWDGVFLWGGPLAYSLAGMCISIATFLAFREAAAPDRSSTAMVVSLILFALYCHPFAAPFALVLCCLRYIWVPHNRRSTLLLTATVIVYSYVIVRDSPPSEAVASHHLNLLFGLNAGQIEQRIIGLFRNDYMFTNALFGFVPWADTILFVVYGIIHLLGFVGSPFVAWQERKSPWLGMLMTLNTAIAIMYLLAWDTNLTPIPEWPQRILTLYAPFTFLAGFVVLVRVSRWMRLPRFLSVAWTRILWVPPILLLSGMVAAQVPILRCGGELKENYFNLRDGIVKSPLSRAYVVVSGMDTVRPFYLRCVPFLLFSDPAIVAKHILIGTEWHFKERCPSRVVENMIDVGRPPYLANFSMRQGRMALDLQEQPQDRFPVIERTNVLRWGNASELAADQFREGYQLLDEGVYVSALGHLNSAIHLQPTNAHAWNDGGAALFRAQRFPESVEYFQHAVEIDPKLTEARLNLAKALVNAGRPAEAIPVLDEYIRLEPGNEEARELRRKLPKVLQNSAR